MKKDDFYLGTHIVNWLWNVDIPLFISRRRLKGYKTVKPALSKWALDSGGFTELSMYGGWTIGADQYAEEVQQHMQRGKMEWCAPQDWMCEPFIIAKTGLSVDVHIGKTIENYCQLKEMNIPVIPVLQGWKIDDYENCITRYSEHGVDLAAAETVGLGSVCRRQASDEIGQIAKLVSDAGIKAHGFGVKAQGIKKYGHYLKSADSLSWSFTGRYLKQTKCGKQSCSNCLHFALEWRDNVLNTIR